VRLNSFQNGNALLISTALLALTSVGFAYDRQRLPSEVDTPLVLALFPVGIATAVFVIVVAVVPNLIATGRLKWPLNVTLPIVYGAILQLCVALASRGPNPLVKQILISRACDFWMGPNVFFRLLLAHMLILGTWSFVTGRLDASE
jgi:hypothetical protein